MTIFQIWKARRQKKRLKKVITQAEEMWKTTRMHHLVLNWAGEFKIITRTALKEMIAQKKFHNNVKLRDFEKSAIYKTY